MTCSSSSGGVDIRHFDCQLERKSCPGLGQQSLNIRSRSGFKVDAADPQAMLADKACTFPEGAKRLPVHPADHASLVHQGGLSLNSSLPTGGLNFTFSHSSTKYFHIVGVSIAQQHHGFFYVPG